MLVKYEGSGSVHLSWETFHACVIDVRHPGLLPKQYVAVCVLDAIVSTRLPNIFVFIGLAALARALVFCFSVVFVLVREIVHRKSHTLLQIKGSVHKEPQEQTIILRFEVNMDGGGGDSFDPCECICSHEGAMRRLISLVSSNDIFQVT